MRFLSIAIGLLSGLLFGLSTPLSKLILTAGNSFQVAGYLYLGAALAFLPHVVLKGRKETTNPRSRKSLARIAGIVACGGILGPVLLMSGLRVANSSSVSVWLNLELVATATLGTLFFKDHLDGRAWAGVGLTLLAGIAVGLQEGAAGLGAGLLVAAACLAWAVDNHLTALVDGFSPQTITFVKGLVGGLVNVAMGAALAGGGLAFPGAQWALLLGVFSYGVSIVLYVTSAQNLGATRSQILFSTGPFWGMFAAFAFLGERVTVAAIGAAVLLAAGIILSSTDRHEHGHSHEVIRHTHLHTHDDLHHDHAHAVPAAPGTRHEHEHEHAAMEHSHPHYPDLHHRHSHGA
jgi:drug/metabolite transporter (DMT)-like permease